MKDYTLLKPIRWLSCRLLGAVDQKTKCSSLHSKVIPGGTKSTRISLAVPEDAGIICPADG